VYDIDVTAGAANLSRMLTSEHVIGRLLIPGLNPKLPIVKVSGNSMSPRINNGAYISIRLIDDDDPILWGQIYVVMLEDYRMVKYVRRHEDPSKVILHSENPDFDDIVISRDKIVGMFLVESILNYEIVG
ncbi:MAG: S24 family peptidase, partial [Paramuribaculum sp.]|nr:S24 family peptidase [Paramuribaculum sp.]